MTCFKLTRWCKTGNELKSLESPADEEGYKFHFASIYTLIKRLLKICSKIG